MQLFKLNFCFNFFSKIGESFTLYLFIILNVPEVFSKLSGILYVICIVKNILTINFNCKIYDGLLFLSIFIRSKVN